MIKHPNIKCFFGSHDYLKMYRSWGGCRTDELVSLACQRKNCSSYHVKGINKWFSIGDYKGGK